MTSLLTANSTPAAAAPAPPGQPAQRLAELSEIIRAYNQVTENLQRSHEALVQQVQKLQEQLASKDAQLQRSQRLAALGEMAAGIAHEVRNPLAAIQLYAEMIAGDLEQAAPVAGNLQTTLEQARKISSVVRGLDAIVRDILTFARDMTPRRQPVELAALWARVIAAHQPAIAAGDVQVVCRLGRGANVVEADPDLLHQALLNLVRNAVDAMTDKAGSSGTLAGVGKTSRVLTFAARRESAGVALSVRDTGPGVAPEALDRLFNPFFTTRKAGTGLGLAIVHRIVDAHGGAIDVKNDHGAVFTIHLPVRGRSRSVGGRTRGVQA